MQDKIVIQAPAKINLFFRVLNKRNDEYHNIRTGITFINLFDEVSIVKSNSMSIKYLGTFKPTKGFYDDCIIEKTLKFLNIYNKINLQIIVKKNIPVQGGLGSASTNAAAVIKGLEQLKIIKPIINYKHYCHLGADIPVFLYGQNSLVQGMGDEIFQQKFPKYYFLVVKPEINFSTKIMYKKISKYIQNNNHTKQENNNLINSEDFGNDFEKIAIKEHVEIDQLLKFLSNSKDCIFARMTGTGSCCYAAYDNLQNADIAQSRLQDNFPRLWSFVGKNNSIN